MSVRSQSSRILSETYGDRLEASDLIAAAGGSQGGDAVGLRQVAGKLDGLAARFTDPKIGVAYYAFAELIRITGLLVEWRQAVLDAAPDPDRFKRGALERLKIWHSEYKGREEVVAQVEAVQDAGTEIAVADVGPLCLALSRIPLPLGIRGDQREGMRIPPFAGWKQVDREPKTELHIAFLSFSVDGKPADQIQFLTPLETHDLDIEVRVSRWPEGAQELRLSPVSIEAASTYDFPKFALVPPTGAPPFVIRQRGRATIKVGQALRAQPFEFRYAAEFWPKETEQPVSVVGHRTLRIESIDITRSPLTGYSLTDQRLLDVRNQLRAISPMPQRDLDAAMAMAIPLASLAARALQDDLFPEKISEARFQSIVRDELRRRPEIGAQLDEHPRAAGGETDLSFLGLRLELKVVPDRRMALQDCQAFIEQTAMYAVGSGKRLALLCVLDVSPKSDSPTPAEDGLGILFAKSGIPILTLLIQGALARPSDLSRRSRRRITS
jgi:hypothetical protein